MVDATLASAQSANEWIEKEGEGLGLVLLEVQANGCVPVATKLPGISDYAVEEGVTGLLTPEGDAAALAGLAGPRAASTPPLHQATAVLTSVSHGSCRSRWT